MIARPPGARHVQRDVSKARHPVCRILVHDRPRGHNHVRHLRQRHCPWYQNRPRQDLNQRLRVHGPGQALHKSNLLHALGRIQRATSPARTEAQSRAPAQPSLSLPAGARRVTISLVMSAPPTTATAPRAWTRDPRRWAFAGAGLVAVGLGWDWHLRAWAAHHRLPNHRVLLLCPQLSVARRAPAARPAFAPYMQALDTGRGLSPAAARRAWASLWTSLLFSLAILRAAGRLPLWLGATIVGAGLVGTATIAVLTPVPAADCPRRRAKPAPPLAVLHSGGRGSALTDDTEGAQVLN